MGNVRSAQRIAVHRRIGEGRLGAQRGEVARQHAAEGGVEPDPLLLQRRPGGSEHARQRFLDRDHAAHSLSLPARHAPDLPPRFSTSRIASTLMKRSIALAMS